MTKLNVMSKQFPNVLTSSKDFLVFALNISFTMNKQVLCSHNLFKYLSVSFREKYRSMSYKLGHMKLSSLKIINSCI